MMPHRWPGPLSGSGLLYTGEESVYLFHVSGTAGIFDRAGCGGVYDAEGVGTPLYGHPGTSGARGQDCRYRQAGPDQGGSGRIRCVHLQASWGRHRRQDGGLCTGATVRSGPASRRGRPFRLARHGAGHRIHRRKAHGAPFRLPRRRYLCRSVC